MVFTCCVISALTFSRCVDEVHIDQDFNETQKLVLYCRLCPQLDTNYILLTNTTLLYANNNTAMVELKDGVVELSADGHQWTTATYESVKKRFYLTKEEFPVEEGHTYYIRASHPDFEDVSSSCTVLLVHDVGFRFDTVSVSSDMHLGQIYDWPHKDVYAEWRDVAGEENAYAIGYKRLSPIHVWSDEGDAVFYEWRFDIDWLNEGNIDYWYVSDEDRDGQVMRFIHDVDLYEHEEDDEWAPPLEQQRYLLFLDRNCYQYEITLPNDEFGMLNFLFLEPEHTYTNIENGFGLFGAFSMLEVK